MLETLDIGTIVNGSAALVSVYMATQIKLVVKNHEFRIQELEDKADENPIPRKRIKRRNKRTR